jgi:lipopolysaccharide transport system ATP-binding protein
MGEVAKSGRTVLFVSHNMTMVQSLCNKCILLDEGRIKYEGSAAETVDHYLTTNEISTANTYLPRQSNKIVEIRKVGIVQNDLPITMLSTAAPFSIEIEYEVKEDLKQDSFLYVLINNLNEQYINETYDLDSNPDLYHTRKKGKYKAIFSYPGETFNQQECFINVGCGIPPSYNFKSKTPQDYFDSKENIRFSFYHESEKYIKKYFMGRRLGYVLLQIPCKTEFSG